MIKIQVENEFLDLAKVSVTFELTSPVFNQVGSFSYPFTIPATAKNKRLLSFPGKINKYVTTSHEFDAKIFLGGQLWKTGSLVVDETGLLDIKCHFTVGEGYFYNLIKEIMLNKIDLGGDNYTSDIYITDRWQKTYPEVEWTLFPIYDQKFYDSLDHDGFKEYYSTYLQNKINAWFNSSQQWGSTNNTLVPFVFLNYVILQVFDHLGLKVDKNDIFNNPDLKNLVLINLTSLCELYTSGENLINDIPATYNLQKHVPKKPLNEFFSFLEKQFLAFLFYEEKSNTASLETFHSIANKLNANLIMMEAISNLIVKTEYYNGYQVIWEKDSEDASMSEPWTVDISSFTIKTVDLFSELPAIIPDNELYFCVERATYYGGILGSNPSYPEYKSKGGPYNDFKTGTKNFEIKPAADVNFSQSVTGSYRIFKEGSYKFDNVITEIEEYFKVLFFCTTDQPRGSIFHDNTDTNSQSLAWWGEKGLYESFFKEYLTMMQNKIQADFKLKTDLAFLRNLKFQEKYRFQEANWLLSKVRFTVTNEKISPAQVTAFKI
jgi:hypothetical protein